MNFPRLGVQNPQFTNAYEMERNAQANRPFSQLLNTGAKVILAYIDQQKKEAEAQQLKDAQNERGAFIENYGSGYLSGLTSPANFLPKLQSMSPADAKAMVDIKSTITPKPVAAQNLTDDKRAVYNQMLTTQSNMRTAGVQPDSPEFMKAQAIANSLEKDLVAAGVLSKDLEGVFSPKEQVVGAPIASAVTAVSTPEQDKKSLIENASADALAIVGGAIDKNNDGVIDNIVELRSKLDGLSRKYGINVKSPEWTAISGLLDTQESAMKERSETAYSRQQDAESREQQKEQSRLTQDEKFQPLFKANQRLQATPQDIPTRRTALNLALRKETGAVIGADEFDAMMSTVLPPADYSRYKKETQNLWVDFAGLTSDKLKESFLKRVSEGYLGNIDSGKLYQYLDDKIPADYYQKKTAGKKTAEAPKTESKLEHIRRLRGGK